MDDSDTQTINEVNASRTSRNKTRETTAKTYHEYHLRLSTTPSRWQTNIVATIDREALPKKIKCVIKRKTKHNKTYGPLEPAISLAWLELDILKAVEANGLKSVAELLKRRGPTVLDRTDEGG